MVGDGRALHSQALQGLPFPPGWLFFCFFCVCFVHDLVFVFVVGCFGFVMICFASFFVLFVRPSVRPSPVRLFSWNFGVVVVDVFCSRFFRSFVVVGFGSSVPVCFLSSSFSLSFFFVIFPLSLLFRVGLSYAFFLSSAPYRIVYVCEKRDAPLPTLSTVCFCCLSLVASCQMVGTKNVRRRRVGRVCV